VFPVQRRGLQVSSSLTRCQKRRIDFHMDAGNRRVIDPLGRSNSHTGGNSTHVSKAFFRNAFAPEVGRKSHIYIYIWEPVPGAKSSVPQALARETLSKKTENIEFTTDEYLATYKFFFDALSVNRPLIERSFSPSKATRSSGVCSVMARHIPPYLDNNHIAKSSTDFWVDMLTRADGRVP
jgi:hypothetical protein